MIYILLVAFVAGYGPRVEYANMGEFNTPEACVAAGAALSKAGRELNIMGHYDPKMVCVRKGQK